MRRKSICTITGITAWIVLLMPISTTQAADPAGKEEYRVCIACHGASGKGDGSMAGVLKIAPTDLTKLSANNGGSFPFSRVFKVLDGRSPLAGHGDSDMPIWGSRFASQYAGGGGALGSEMEVRGRILSLVYYLESMQE